MASHFSTTCGSCGAEIDYSDGSSSGSARALRHYRDHHPEIWAMIEHAERRAHPRTWEQWIAADLGQ